MALVLGEFMSKVRVIDGRRTSINWILLLDYPGSQLELPVQINPLKSKADFFSISE
ncbi:MAG: hypothetical protein HC889_05805 [Synechococcaceae cyanobacterium SM1_2_3]|nr:hypothetical protein [Synechococcaceae cyanobacterium SM1_2_3]